MNLDSYLLDFFFKKTRLCRRSISTSIFVNCEGQTGILFEKLVLDLNLAATTPIVATVQYPVALCLSGTACLIQLRQAQGLREVSTGITEKPETKKNSCVCVVRPLGDLVLHCSPLWLRKSLGFPLGSTWIDRLNLLMWFQACADSPSQ